LVQGLESGQIIAIVSDYVSAVVWSIIGEGAVVASSQSIPGGKVAVGVPAKVIRDVSDADKQLWSEYKDVSADLAVRCPKSFKRIR
jgi:carbonic anhydrase/acetyltransferase-like protein (isoleucine patch superfamily)